jgi:hypothetical protein
VSRDEAKMSEPEAPGKSTKLKVPSHWEDVTFSKLGKGLIITGARQTGSGTRTKAMSDPDVVAELDAWLAVEPAHGDVGLIDCSKVRRARDQILSLRDQCYRISRDNYHNAVEVTKRAVADARAAAFEEAAQLMESVEWTRRYHSASAAIRALKDDKP